MPRRELRDPAQVEAWLAELGAQLSQPGEMTLIGSGALLWHAAQRQIQTPLPESSMDVDPITDSDEIAGHCYNAIIGSAFEASHGWHVNLMPGSVLCELPAGWETRVSRKTYGKLHLIVPAPQDLIAPKLRRNEPRDRRHAAWAKEVGLID